MLSLKLLRVCSFFLVFLMVMLTPAFAMELEEVAHHAEDYNKESKEKKSFFGKIKFLAKGFHLLNEAKEAEKQSNKNKELQEKKEDTDEILFENHNKKIVEENSLLEYRNNKKTVEVQDNHDNKTNITNAINISDGSSVLSVPDSPLACADDANNIVQFLGNMNVQTNLEHYNTIDNRLIGSLVQIIDLHGHLRYIQVTKITLEGKNPGVVVKTGVNENFYSLEEFQKACTGIRLVFDPNTDANQALSYIINKQKNNLNQEKNTAKSSYDHSQNQVIIWGILIGVGVVLLIIGIILTVYFRAQLIQAAREAPKYAVEATQDYIDYMNSPESRKGRIPIDSQTVKKQMAQAISHADSLGQEAFDEFVQKNMQIGIVITLLVGPKLTWYVISQNWVKVILCVVGLILVIVGIGLIIAGIIRTARNSLKRYGSEKVINRNERESKDLEEWVTPNNTLNNTTN